MRTETTGQRVIYITHIVLISGCMLSFQLFLSALPHDVSLASDRGENVAQRKGWKTKKWRGAQQPHSPLQLASVHLALTRGDLTQAWPRGRKGKQTRAVAGSWSSWTAPSERCGQPGSQAASRAHSNCEAGLGCTHTIFYIDSEPCQVKIFLSNFSPWITPA